MRWIVLLLTFAAVPALAQAPGAQSQGAQEGIRAACEADVQRFCPAAAGNPFRTRSCFQENQANLQPRCRDALLAAGLIAAPTGPPADRR